MSLQQQNSPNIAIDIRGNSGPSFFPVPATGGTLHFTDHDNPDLDVTITVPPQVNTQATTLYFGAYRAPADLPNPTGERVVRLLFGFTVVDDHYHHVRHFDPALIVKTRIAPDDLKDPIVKGNPNRLIRLIHNGSEWRRLPMLERDDTFITALTEHFSDCGIGAG